MSQVLPVLYSFRRCPYAIRARLAVVKSGTQVELREVELRNKPAALLQASPKGTVPVMVLPSGEVLEQSLDIMHHCLQRNDPDSWLGSEEPETRSIIEFNDGEFKRLLDQYKYPEKSKVPVIDSQLAAIPMLSNLEDRLKLHKCLLGDSYSVADIAIFPFIRQFAAVNDDWFRAQDIPHLQGWLDTLLQSELFKAAMAHFPRWERENRPVLFP